PEDIYFGTYTLFWHLHVVLAPTRCFGTYRMPVRVAYCAICVRPRRRNDADGGMIAMKRSQ
ncbi:hypothetical protein J8657_18580, partial [Dickeya oryzae]